MKYEPSAAAISHAAEICSPRASAITPHATAPTSATNVQMAIERLRDLVPMKSPPLSGSTVRIPHRPERETSQRIWKRLRGFPIGERFAACPA